MTTIKTNKVSKRDPYLTELFAFITANANGNDKEVYIVGNDLYTTNISNENFQQHRFETYTLLSEFINEYLSDYYDEQKILVEYFTELEDFQINFEY